jgi:hypothetical protein
MSPDMIRASLQAAKSIKPEQMRDMQKMAQAMGANAPGGAPGGMGGMGGMMPPPGGGMGGGMPGAPGGMGMPGGMDMSAAASMMENVSPEMMNQASEMMKTLDPELMASMLSSSTGRKMTPEDAKKLQVRARALSLNLARTPSGRDAHAHSP